MFFNNNRQKSPPRRFLLILGVAAFICFCSLGLMVIFWDRMLQGLPKIQKIGVGLIIIIYAVVRFSRLLRKGQNEI